MRQVSKTIIFFLAITVLLGAEEVLKIATFQIPIMVESKDKGVFIDLVTTAAKKAGFSVNIEVLPTPRAIGAFVQKEYDMLFPALDIQFHDQEKPLASKELIYVKRDFAFSKTGTTICRNIKDLEGKIVGITAAYPYAEEILFNKKLTLEKAPTDEINVKKLLSGRIDVFLVEEKSGLGAFAKEKVTQFDYDKNAPLSQQNVYFAFQKNQKGTALEQKFSSALSELKENGTFANIMKKAEEAQSH